MISDLKSSYAVIPFMMSLVMKSVSPLLSNTTLVIAVVINLSAFLIALLTPLFNWYPDSISYLFLIFDRAGNANTNSLLHSKK